jgi:WD40 repeat protein
MTSQLTPFDRLNPARGHRAYVRSVAVVPGDPPRVLSAGYDGTVRAYRPDDLAPVACVDAHPLGAGVVAVSPVDRLAASGGGDGTVCFWRVGSGLEPAGRCRLPTQGNPIIEMLAWLPDGRGVVVGAVGGSLWLVPRDGEPELVGDGMISINALRFSPCGRFLLVATDECVVRLYCHEAGRLTFLRQSKPFDDHVDALDVRPRPGGRFQAVATTHRNRVWLLDRLPDELTARSKRVSRTALNAALFLGNRVIVAGDDHIIYEVDPDTLDPVRKVPLLRDVDALAAAGPEEVLAATTGGLYRVSIAGGRVVARVQNDGALAGIAAADGLVFAGYHDRPAVTVGDGRGAAFEVRGTVELPAAVSCAAGGQPVFGLSDGKVVEVGPDLQMQVLGESAAQVEGVCVVAGPMGRVVVAVDRSGSALVLGPQGPARIDVTPDGSRLKTVVPAIRPDGSLLLAAGKNHRVYAIDVARPDRPRAWEVASGLGSGRTFNALCPGGDGVLYLACWDGLIHRARLGTEAALGEVLSPLAGHEHAAEGLLWVDGRLVSISYDGTCRVWTGSDSRPLALSTMAVRRLARGLQAGTVLTAGYDGIIHEIDVRGGQVRRSWQVAP